MVLSIALVVLSAGTLDDVRSNAANGPADSATADNDSDGEIVGDLLSGALSLLDPDDEVSNQFILAMFTFPFYTPHVLAEPHGPMAFVYERFPYAHGGRGFIRTMPYIPPPEPVEPPAYTEAIGTDVHWMPGEIIQAPPVSEDAPPQSGPVWTSDDTTAANRYTYEAPKYVPADWDKHSQRWAVQTAADLAIINDNIYRLRPRVRLMMPGRFELDAECGIYRETLADRAIDWTTISALHLAARFAQNEYVIFRLGAGGRMLADAKTVQLGYDFQYGVQIFPHKPLIIDLTAGVGSLGKSFTLDLRASLGVALGPLEILIGAERLAVGDAVLAGPVGGIRYWF